MTRAHFACAFVASLAIGCGASTPGAQPAVGPETAAPGGASGGAARAPDLSPVPAPEELFLVGRIQNPAKFVDTVASWSKLPVDWRQLLAKEEPGLERVVYLDAPIEVAAALDVAGSGPVPQPLAVVSIGLTSLEASVEFARQKGEPVRQIRPGVFRVGGGGDSCAIAASVGKAPARLVCGDRAEDVDLLLPYVTRGLPTEQLGSADMSLEVRAEPIRKRHGRELRQLKLLAPFAVRDFSIDNARFDGALKDAAHGIAEELIALAEDLDRIQLNGWVKGDSIDGVFTLRLRSTGSWSGQTLAEAGKRAAPPGDTFWKLPADSDSASYAVGMDPKRYASIRRTLAELLDGWLEHEKVPRRVRDDLVDLVEEAFKTDGASAYARGSIASAGEPKNDVDRARDMARTELGWHLLAISDKPDAYKKHLGNVVRSYNDPQLRKLLQKRLRVEPKEFPKLSTRPARGLPAGSIVYELAIPASVLSHEPPPLPGDKPARKPPPGKPITFVLVLVPQGQTTWLGISADEKILAEKLNTALKGAQDQTLAGRAGLGPLKTTSAVSGGFFSLSGLLGGMQSALFGMGSGSSRVFASMPHQGKTPMTHLATVKSEGQGLVLDWKVTMPRAVVEDIAAAIPAFASGMMGSGMKPPMAPPPVPAPIR